MDLFNPYNLIDPEAPDPYKDLNESQRVNVAILQGIMYFIFMLVAILFMGLFSGCTTVRTVTVERVRTDTLRITQLQRDSIWLHDSIHVKELVKGDTVWMNVERWHTQYRDRWRTDTVYQSRTDSIPVPYPVEKRVPAELSTWQRIRLWLGNIMLIAIGLAGLWYSRRWWLKLFKII